VVVSGRAPQGHGFLVLTANERRNPPGAGFVQAPLTFADEREPDTRAAMSGRYGQAVHVAAPAVPGGNEGSDHAVVAPGDQKRAGVAFDEAG
jgi:hypothetical protein